MDFGIWSLGFGLRVLDFGLCVLGFGIGTSVQSGFGIMSSGLLWTYVLLILDFEF